VIRLNPDGTRDASFGSEGIPGSRPGEVWLYSLINGAVLTAGNGLVVFGDIHNVDFKCPFNGCENATLVFLNANGRFEGKASRLKKPYWDARIREEGSEFFR
jgi:hypothetical protein